MRNFLLFTLLLALQQTAFAGTLDSCGIFSIKGIITKKEKKQYTLTVFPGQMSSIDLDIYQTINYEPGRLPKNLELFINAPVLVEGEIKKRIKARIGEIIVTDVSFRKPEISDSLDIKEIFKLKESSPCLD